MKGTLGVFVAAAIALAVPHAGAWGQSGTRVHSVTVPYNVGGLPDIVARIVTEKVSERTRRQFVIENKAGGSGVIGLRSFLGSATPENGALLILDDNTASLNPVMIPNLPYDPDADFAPVAQVVTGYVYLVTSARNGFKSLEDMIVQAKANPGKIAYGSPGTLTLHHLGMERLIARAGISMPHVPYRGAAAATTDLVRGEIKVMFATLTSVKSLVDNGDLRILAVAAPAPSPLTPDVPTIASLGFPGFEASLTMGFAAAKGTPQPLIDELNAEINAAVADPEVTRRIMALGVIPVRLSPAEFGAALRRDRDMYRRFVVEENFKIPN